MLLTSTSEVYGDPEVHPQKETYWGNVNPIGPRACYDEGKRVAETMMYAICCYQYVCSCKTDVIKILCYYCLYLIDCVGMLMKSRVGLRFVFLASSIHLDPACIPMMVESSVTSSFR